MPEESFCKRAITTTSRQYLFHPLGFLISTQPFPVIFQHRSAASSSGAATTSLVGEAQTPASRVDVGLLETSDAVVEELGRSSPSTLVPRTLVEEAGVVLFFGYLCAVVLVKIFHQVHHRFLEKEPPIPYSS
jgi:hypothetical protein